jgi:hypothetical protein
MRITNTIQKTHGKVSSAVPFWSRQVVPIWTEIELHASLTLFMQAYKHIFTSPSSVEKEASRATRSGNARIHGMTSVTPASIAYVATQVRMLYQPICNYTIIPLQTRFALSSSAVFSRSDTVTDSERFFSSIVELFEDPEEKEEVEDLLVWWNRCGRFSHSLPTIDLSCYQPYIPRLHVCSTARGN